MGFKKTTRFTGLLFCIFSPQFPVLVLFTEVCRPTTHKTNAVTFRHETEAVVTQSPKGLRYGMDDLKIGV